MKPPKVSRALLQKSDVLQPTGGVYPRNPLGLLPNALPRFWLAVGVTDGSLLVMHDRSKNPDGATGPQVCLAVIAPETLATLLASKQPLELKP